MLHRIISCVLAMIACISIHTPSNAQTAECDSALTPPQTVTPYFFQHQYLSIVAPQVTTDLGEIFEASTFLNTLYPIDAGFESPFADQDIKVETIVKDGATIYVWQFPESPYLREALYMAFFPVDDHYEAFAICRGREVDWEISTSTSTARSCFGRVKKPESANECVDLLIERGAFNGQISPGEFFQEDYQSPDYRP